MDRERERPERERPERERPERERPERERPERERPERERPERERPEPERPEQPRWLEWLGHVRAGSSGAGTSDGGDDHRVDVVLAVALAAVTGFVDAVGFLHLFEVFPANQSGNLVLLGMSIGKAGPTPGWLAATSIIGFFAGIVLAVSISQRWRPTMRPTGLLAVELALLVLLASWTAALWNGDAAPGIGVSTQFGLLVVASVAMGIQTEVIRSAAGIQVATTYQTGSVARLGETAGGLVAGLGRGGGARRLAMLGILPISYVAGAALGSTGLGSGRAGLAVPAATVALVLVAAFLTRSQQQ